MSKTAILKNPAHSRFSDAQWYTGENTRVTLGGAGGIGSWLSIFLSRIGFEICLYEMDTIEEHNIGGQAYFKDHIGLTKAESVYEVCDMMCEGANMIPLGKFEEASEVSPITFAAFDNMHARKLMFEQWKKLVKSTKDKQQCLFIDGRMTAETGIIYYITPDRIEKYESEFFDDSEISDEPCSYKATSHNGAMLSSIMLQGFLNTLGNKKLGVELYSLPFRVNYELPMITLNSVE